MTRKFLFTLSAIFFLMSITGCKLSGKVVLENGEELAGVSVEINAIEEDYERTDTLSIQTTDENGKFVVEEGSQALAITPTLDGYMFVPQSVVRHKDNIWDVSPAPVVFTAYEIDTECGKGVLDEEFVHVNTSEDLVALRGYSEITGNLIIDDDVIPHNTILNLDALNCLKRVGGSLQIIGNDRLEDITGLSSLESVGGMMLIGDVCYVACLGNYNLTKMKFSSLTSVGGALSINFNTKLTHLEGMFDALLSANGIAIHWCHALTGIGSFDSLTSVRGICIDGNDSLCNHVAQSWVDDVISRCQNPDSVIVTIDNVDCL